MEWWNKLAMVSNRGRLEEIVEKVFDINSNPMARTMAVRIVSERLFNRLGFPQRLKLIVDLEAMRLARELNERLYKDLPRKLRKMIDKKPDKDFNPIIAIVGSSEIAIPRVKDEIERIITNLNLDIIDDPTELLIYARDLTLYYYLEIVAISKVYHVSEIDALKSVEYMIDNYLKQEIS